MTERGVQSRAALSLGIAHHEVLSTITQDGALQMSHICVPWEVTVLELWGQMSYGGKTKKVKKKKCFKAYFTYDEINKPSDCPSGKLQYKAVECGCAGDFLGIWTKMEEFTNHSPSTVWRPTVGSKTWRILELDTRWPIQPCLLKKKKIKGSDYWLTNKNLITS